MPEMEQLKEEMMEYVCDSLCRHPGEADNQEETDRRCAECRMDNFASRIACMQLTLQKRRQEETRGGIPLPKTGGRVII